MYTAFSAVSTALGLTEDFAIFAEAWPQTEATFPAELPEFLQERYVAETGEWLRWDPALREEAVRGLDFFRRYPAAVRLAWHCHEALFTLGTTYETLQSWPRLLPEALGDEAALFYLYVMLSGVPYARCLHAERGIAEEVTIDTLSVLGRQARGYLNRHGHWGFVRDAWLWHHFNGVIYRLGRLEFALVPFWLNYPAFRHCSTRQVVVLAGDGIRYRSDGQVDGVSGISDPAAWTATLRTDDNRITGHPITPDGRALPMAVTLGCAEWKQVLAPDDSVANIHIPGQQPLDHAACGDALQRAIAFYARHYPEQPFKAFTCGSWLLDNQFDALLPPTSNIRRFLREMYLLPLPDATDKDTFAVFGERCADPANLPQRNSLQRALARHVQAGGHFHSGGCLLFPDDLAWGDEVYRNGRAWGYTEG